MKTICIKLSILSLLFTSFAALGQIQYSNEFWISTNATGNMYPSSLGTSGGTLANPLDGSTVANFDSNMNNLPANCTIHIMPGTYQTHGGDGWWVHTGEKIIGSGIDVTTLQLVPTSGDNFTYTIASEDYLTNVVVSGMTIDCNYTTGSHTPCGITLGGTENTVRYVKVINTAKYGGSTEAWGINIKENSSGMSEGNVIENCEVSQFLGGTSNLSAIGFLPGVSGVIRDNVVLNDNPNNIVGAFFGGCEDLIEGNYAFGVDTGSYNDTSVVTNIIMSDNIFANVRDGFNMQSPFYKNITFSGNTILLSTNNPFQIAFSIAPSELSTNVNITGNTVGWYSAETTDGGYFLAITNVQGLVVADNRVDGALQDDLYEGTDNYVIRDNYDLSGNYLPINIPTIGGTPVSPLGLDLIGSYSQGTVLTDLGLPSNPSVIITNGEPLSTLDVENGAIITNGLTVHGNASISGETDLGGAPYVGSFALSALGLSGNSLVAEFISSTNDFDSMILFGRQDYTHLMYIGAVRDPGYDSFEIIGNNGSTNNPIAVFNSNQNGGNGYVGIGTNVPSQALTVAGSILATGTNYATQFVGGGAGITGLNASQLVNGTVPLSQLPGSVITNNATGVTLNGTFSGNGGAITNITYVDDSVFCENILAANGSFGYGLVQLGPIYIRAIQESWGSIVGAYFEKAPQFASAAIMNRSLTNFVYQVCFMQTNTIATSTNAYEVWFATNNPNGGYGTYQPWGSAPYITSTGLGANAITVSTNFSVPYSILTNTFAIYGDHYNGNAPTGSNATNNFVLWMRLFN